MAANRLNTYKFHDTRFKKFQNIDELNLWLDSNPGARVVSWRLLEGSLISVERILIQFTQEGGFDCLKEDDSNG